MNTPRSTRRGLTVLAYVTSVHLIALGAMAWTCRSTGADFPIPLGDIAFWLVLTLAAELFWLETPTGDGMISMSLAVNVATLYVLPPHLAIGVGAMATLVADLLIHRRGMVKAAFNASQVAITIAGCAVLIRALGGDPTAAGVNYLLQEPLAVIAGPVCFFALNTGLVAGVIALHRSEGFARTWLQNFGFRYQVLSSSMLSLLGLILVASVDTIGYIAGILYLLFFFFVRDAYNRYVQSRRAAQAVAGRN